MTIKCRPEKPELALLIQEVSPKITVAQLLDKLHNRQEEYKRELQEYNETIFSDTAVAQRLTTAFNANRDCEDRSAEAERIIKELLEHKKYIETLSVLNKIW